MLDLIKNFSIQQIILFVVLLALAIKGIISFFDWVKEKNKKVAEDISKPIKMAENIQKHDQQIDQIKDSIDSLTKKIDMLIDSDKDDIKAFITREHHYFCYQKGWIDDYSLDCVERRYAHYEQEGGNSFVEDLMKDLRKLPKQQLQSKN